MSFVVSCIVFAFIGSLVGVIAHLFNGVVQSHITFNRKYGYSLLVNFLKVSLVWVGTSLVTSIILLSLEGAILMLVNVDKAFLHGLVYYLYAFASFDFALKHIVERKDSLTLQR